MRRETTAAQKGGARRETLDASEARRETRDVRRGSSLSSCNLVSRLTSHAPAPWSKATASVRCPKKLEEICLFIADCPHSTAPDEGHGFPLVRTPNIGNGRLVFEKMHRVSRAVYETRNKRAKPQAGDLIYAREAPAGNVALITKGQEVCLGQRTVLLRPNPAMADSAFLTYYLLAPEQRHRLLGTATGATVTHVNLPAIRNLEVALPPLPVQRRIADVLSAYDDLIENNRRRIAILEEMARLTYRKWFGGSGAKGGMRYETIDASEAGRETRDVRRVSSLPSHASVSRLTSHALPRSATLEEVCREVRRGVSPDAIAPDTPYIGLEHMPRRSISLCEWESAQKITSTKLAFETGDILFGKIRPYFHKVGIAFVDGVASSDAIVIKPNRSELLAYVLMTVSSDAFVAAASQGMKEGSKMPRADWKQLLRYCVVLPDAETLSAFNKVLNPILAQLKTLCFSTRTLAGARDMLLPRLMKGEMNV